MPTPSERTWTGFNPKRLQECGIVVERADFWVRDVFTNNVRLMTDAEWDAVMQRAAPAGRDLAPLRAALAALEAVEWGYSNGGWSAQCRWCKGYERHPAMDQDYYGVAGHKADCPRQLAIALLKDALALASRGDHAHALAKLTREDGGR